MIVRKFKPFTPSQLEKANVMMPEELLARFG